MPIFFSVLLLSVLSVLAWRDGAVTRWLERRRLKKQMRSADFWMHWKPPNEPANGISWQTTVMVDDGATVETCDRCGPYTVAAHFAVKGMLLIGLCGHCGAVHQSALERGGWEMLHALVPVTAAPVG